MPLSFESIEWRTAPRRDGLEITVLGPGYGESIVIHVGGGKWIIIDSCIDTSNGEPAPLSYLRSIGVHPPENVELVIATHWHDDHVAGLSEVVRVCESAKFCCAAALAKSEFQAMLEALNERTLTAAGSKTRELYEVTRILLGRKQPIKAALSDRPVLRITADNTSHGYDAVVHTLSPSDKQLQNFHRDIGDLIDDARKVGRARDRNPNHIAVAAHIEVGPFALLAGADLEETGDPQTGWSNVLASSARPGRRAKIYKVAHHGSPTGHHDGIWTDLLEEGAINALTPWNRGKKLPQQSDLNRLKALGRTFVTATTSAGRTAKNFSHSVTRQLRHMNIKISRSEPRLGAIRFRGTPADDISKFTIELAGQAFEA